MSPTGGNLRAALWALVDDPFADLIPPPPARTPRDEQIHAWGLILEQLSPTELPRA